MQSKMAPWAFVLAVPDINRSSEYFRGVLGFHISWQDATDWRLVERDGVRIMLGQCPTDIHPSALGSHNWFGYLDVDDVDGLFKEMAEVALEPYLGSQKTQRALAAFTASAT